RVLEVALVQLLHQTGVGTEVVEALHRTSFIGRLRCAVPPSGHGSATSPCSRVASESRSATEEFGHLERQIERLASVEPRVAAGLVALLEVVAEHFVAATEALGDVLAGELDVHTARPHVSGVTGGEEPVQL